MAFGLARRATAGYLSARRACKYCVQHHISQHITLRASPQGCRKVICLGKSTQHTYCGIEPQLIKLDFIIYLSKLRVFPLNLALRANSLKQCARRASSGPLNDGPEGHKLEEYLVKITKYP